MKPKIDGTQFGSITVSGKLIEHDIVINLAGEVRKRRKKLSKKVFGTSHVVSVAEVEDIYEEGAEWLLIGTGQTGLVRLSPEAASYLAERHCQAKLLPTPEAVRVWNEANGKGIALFHVTC